MTLGLARGGVLDPERGDVVLFANTTAEHPGTYEFAARVCDEIEQAHALPCLWYEFCTVETARRGGYARAGSYRLVARRGAAGGDDPAVPGYRTDGSAFEELASWKLMLPNRHLRICTTHLKMLPGAALAAQWIGGSEAAPHAGHHQPRSLTSPRDMYARYRGPLDADMYETLTAFAHRRPHNRPRQRFQDFTAVPLGRAGARDAAADVWGKRGRPCRYVTLLGLRADEPDRVDKMLMRSWQAEGAARSGCKDSAQPAGEMTYAPMSDHGATTSDVRRFWDAQPYDLEAPDGAGNCVFCFMKGSSGLSRVALNANGAEGPAAIEWWSGIEQRYGRPNNDGRRFQFLGFGGPSYEALAAGAAGGGDAALPCACTD